VYKRQGLGLGGGIAAGALPAYAMAVLCAFYGAAILLDVFDYFFSPGGVREKFSLEAKLYPKIFALFMLINTYVAVFSYGTAQQLIDTTFGNSKWDSIRGFLKGNSIAALDMMSFVCLSGLFSAVVRKAAAKFGAVGSDHTEAARLLAKSTVMNARLQQLNGDALIASLSEYGADDLKRLGVDPLEFGRDKQILDGSRVSANPALWSAERGDPKAPLLSELSQVVTSYGAEPV
jgi:hypothetical protein